MQKKLRIAIDVVVIIVAFIFLFIGIKDAIDLLKGKELDDNVKFARTYSSVLKDNSYEYTSINDVLEAKSTIILIGETTDPWMHVLVSPLDNIAKKYGKKIKYLELDGLDTSSKEYKKLENLYGKLSSPMIILIKNGTTLTVFSKKDIIDNDFDGAPIEYFDIERTKNLADKLSQISNLD
ncbi:MAG TPA: hypothetical protein DCY94_03445 [Firmicutes bacterium]|nr:hypothetical protein [Bacillota bacterium]